MLAIFGGIADQAQVEYALLLFYEIRYKI